MVPFVMQRDHSKKRQENHHFESNGTSGKSFSFWYLFWLVQKIPGIFFSFYLSLNLFFCRFICTTQCEEAKDIKTSTGEYF